MVLNKKLYSAVNSSVISDLCSFTVLGMVICSYSLWWCLYKVSDASSDTATVKESDGEIFLKPPKRAQLQKKKKCLPFLLWPYVLWVLPFMLGHLLPCKLFGWLFIPHLFEKEFMMTFYVFFKLFLKFFSNLPSHAFTFNLPDFFIIFHFPPFSAASDIWKLSSYFKYLPFTWY